ncbi:MAG TPA: ribosomal protein L7/L12 [Candidatus Limnocylindrales bacterium]|nr:ribosomal protein L7/L12 [Candidatus Limnocylindrales bacterium]
MRRVLKSSVLSLVLWVICLSLFVKVLEVEGAETLTVTKEAELKSAPQAGSKPKTVILRNTKVEWTGNRKGPWLEVRLPSGLQGWIQENSVSTPKSVIPSTPARTQPPPESVTPSDIEAPKQPTPVDNLEELKKKYEAELDQFKQLLLERQNEIKAKDTELKSKDDTIAQLNQEIEALKTQLTRSNEAGKGVQGTLEEAQNKIKDLENQLSQIQKTLSDKTKEVETLSAQNASLKQQIAEGASGSSWSLYLIPILLGLLIGLAVYTFRYRVPREAIPKSGAPFQEFEGQTEKIKPSLTPDKIQGPMDQSSWKELAQTTGALEKEEPAKTVKGEVAPTSYEKEDPRTRRIPSEPEPKAEPVLTRGGATQSLSPSDSETEEPQALSGERFDIRLTKVGDRKDKVLQMLFKVKGLVRSPEELINSVPCTIARNVEKFNAEKFRHYMNRVGATIELVKSEEE